MHAQSRSESTSGQIARGHGKWIAGTLLLLAAGLILKLSLLVYAMYVLLGVLFIGRFLTRSWIVSIEASRQPGADVFEVGAQTNVVVEVRNRGSTRIPWMILEDHLPREALAQTPIRLKVEGARLKLLKLKPGESATMNYSVTFQSRGYFQLGPTLLETGDLFGLHRRFRVTAEPRFALVLPKVLPLRGYNLASRRPIGQIRIAHRLFEDPTRIAGIRAYQQGDPLNRIHWRATARTGQLHSRVFDSSRVAGATFLLDFHEENYKGSFGARSAELAVTTVASLANAIYLMGQQIGLISNGRDAAERIRAEGWSAEFLTRSAARKRAESGAPDSIKPVIVPTRKGTAQFTNLLMALARLELTKEMEFHELLIESASEIRRDATVVAVLRRVTPQIAASLGALARRGFLVTAVVVSFEEWEMPDWARPPDWAEMLLESGVDFRMVNSEETLGNLCAEAIAR